MDFKNPIRPSYEIYRISPTTHFDLPTKGLTQLKSTDTVGGNFCSVRLEKKLSHCYYSNATSKPSFLHLTSPCGGMSQSALRQRQRGSAVVSYSSPGPIGVAFI